MAGAKLTIAILVISVVLISLVDQTRAEEVTTTSKPPEFTVNLDDAPENRWTQIVKKYPGAIPLSKYVITEFVPSFVFPLIEKIAAKIDKYLPSQYAREIKGMAKATNGSVGDFVLINIIYDLTAFCTSIVAEDSKGQLWHARNLDYGLDVRMANMLRNLTITVNFNKGGKHLYSATTYAGYIGILTAQKPNAFTISIDERKDGSWWMNALMAILNREAQLMSFLVRNTVENAPDFVSLVHTLANTPTIAPVYFIVGGAKESQAAVITKDRMSARDIWYMDTLHEHWYIVETNYDHWEPAPKRDDRRGAAMGALNATGRAGINADSMLKILSTPPVLQQTTTYTTVMSAMNPNVYRTYIQHPSKDVKDTIKWSYKP